MRYLVAESVALKPHLETGGEVAIRLLSDGHEVYFCWLGDDLPWSDWLLPKGAKLIGCSLDQRVKKFIKLLSLRGVQIVEFPILDSGRTEKAYQWALAFQGDIEILKNYRFEGAPLGMGAASSLISFHGDSLYSPDANVQEARRCLTSSALVFERALCAILQVRPDVVITFNGRFATSKAIVAAAEFLNIPVLRHERGSTYERYEIFSDAVHNYAYIRKRILNLWDATLPAQRIDNGNNFFIRRRGGDGIGWYSFTAEQKAGYIPEKKFDRKRIVYFSSSDDEYAAVSDSFQIGPWPDQLTAVGELIDICAKYSNVELIIRVHPHLTKKSKQEQLRWSGFEADNLCVISPGEIADSYALLDSADIVISYGSTMGMEAAYWGKPSIVLGPCSYAGTPPVITVASRLELNEILMNLDDLQPPNQELCLPYGNYYLSYGEQFRYYSPSSLSDGSFLGERLGWDPDFVYWLRKIGFGKLCRKILGKTNR